jgi:hypothetical protein
MLSRVGSPLPVIDSSGRSQAIAANQPIIWSHGYGAPFQRQRLIAAEKKYHVNPVESGQLIFISGTHLMDDPYSDNFWRQNISELEDDQNAASDDEANANLPIVPAAEKPQDQLD